MVQMGFKELTESQFLILMKKVYFEFTQYIERHGWLVFEGDLEIDPEQLKLFEDYKVIIDGDLIVNGVMDCKYGGCLFVTGDVRARSIFIQGTTCSFNGISYFEDVLVVFGGDGETVYIVDPRGPFVGNDISSAMIQAKEKNVKAFVDNALNEYFGDIKNTIKDEYFEVDEDDYLDGESDEPYIDCYCSSIYKDVLKGKSVLVKG
ncbi:hypothetical protein KDW99_01460 [Marinomonas rhizomae]|uniref:hypothetical protein n=1 Tax=Marinomonas rhizomae TaxID=491948 RepID=UPI002105C3C9|nr:hypothetical protein [Marinomonas rhizomae]UTV99844.1 hypothetical protein KDW99_01460 [Marinomonas rhizomae]